MVQYYEGHPLEAIGVVLLFCLLCLLTFLWARKKKKRVGKKEGVSALPDKLMANRQGWIQKISEILNSRSDIDENLYRKLEETLVTADIGIHTSNYLLDRLKNNVTRKELKNPIALKEQLRQELLAILLGENSNGGTSPGEILPFQSEKPVILMVIGVNGVGKTTTIGKLAKRFVGEGKKVLLAAGDTFRAAAVEQLEIWGNRVGVEVIAHKGGKDPSAVAFDATQAAQSRGMDLLIVDTAGRLHTKVNLMEELKKICRTINKKIDKAPHEIWLVLDATTGQNALQQAKKFHEELGGITGIILTKLDGTAKGGILISLAEELKIPIRFIGVGEQVEDLRVFNAQEYVDALFVE